MPGFTDLDIHKDGEGLYNLNRFRVAFRSDFGPECLAQLLIANFPGFFNSSAARVERCDGDKLKFYGNLKLGDLRIPTPHPDWVRVVYTNPKHGFVVQTLHRDSIAADDVHATAGGAAGGGLATGGLATIPASIVGAIESERLNRYHFLAGRRGWRVDYASKFSTPGDGEPFAELQKKNQQQKPGVNEEFLMFETAAVERASSKEINLISGLMKPLVIEIWSNMVTKFSSMPQIKVLSSSEWPLEWGWSKHSESVHYTWQMYNNPAQVESSPDLVSFRHLYPLLYMAPGD